MPRPVADSTTKFHCGRKFFSSSFLLLFTYVLHTILIFLLRCVLGWFSLLEFFYTIYVPRWFYIQSALAITDPYDPLSGIYQQFSSCCMN